MITDDLTGRLLIKSTVFVPSGGFEGSGNENLESRAMGKGQDR